jgi:hypothetical protein
MSAFAMPSPSASIDFNPLLQTAGLALPAMHSPQGYSAFGPPPPQPVQPFRRTSAPSDKSSTERARSGAGSLERQNPLTLLAEASHTAQTPLLGIQNLHTDRFQPLPHLCITAETPMLGLRVGRDVLQSGLHAVLEMPLDGTLSKTLMGRNDYFTRHQSDHRDIGETLDPCELGLLDEGQLDTLWSVYFSSAHQCAPTLDPDLHTPAYVRSHSAMLLTVVALLGAQTMPGEALLTRRLHRHVQFLRKQIYLHNYRSIEIVQAFNLLALWPRSGATLAEDQSGVSLAHAIAISLELGLERDVELRRGPSGVVLEGDVEAQRHQRNRERTAVTLFVWDRAWACATVRALASFLISPDACSGSQLVVAGYLCRPAQTAGDHRPD